MLHCPDGRYRAQKTTARPEPGQGLWVIAGENPSDTEAWLSSREGAAMLKGGGSKGAPRPLVLYTKKAVGRSRVA